MEFESKIKEVQHNLRDQKIDGWLLFDFHHSNDLAWNFLKIPAGKMTTRRFFYWIPQTGTPIKIVPVIEPYTLDHLPGIKNCFKGWQELEKILFAILVENPKIAMEYSPFNALPSVSKVDAGIVDLIRKAGAEAVSSADILQHYTSVWTSEQLQTHRFAAKALESIVSRTWAFIERNLQEKRVLNEYQVQQFMLQEIHEENCQTRDWPICAVNAHSADPHYAPQFDHASAIHPGDFILLDLWCKQNHPHAVYADIARVGVASRHPTGKQEEIFRIVKEARNEATLFVQENYEKGKEMQGWQVDQVCREFIQKAGYGDFFIHRTGHNLGEEVHGFGANLDNFETHDYRKLLPGTGFTIEPGIYLPEEFGVRLEYDIYLEPDSNKISITGGVQEELVLMQI